MARPKNANPKSRVWVRLSAETSARLELEAFVPQVNFASPQGLKSQIVETALKRYFKEKDRERQVRNSTTEN